MFSTLDRRAIEVGGTVGLTIEILAVTESEAAGDAFVAALGAAEPARRADLEVVQAGPVARRWREGVLELKRRYLLRVLQAGLLVVPASRWRCGERASRRGLRRCGGSRPGRPPLPALSCLS